MSCDLGFLGPAAEQDDQFVTLLAKIDPIARSEFYLILRYAFSYALYVGYIPLLQTIQSATVTFAAACVSSPENHLANGETPAFRYSTTFRPAIHSPKGNIFVTISQHMNSLLLLKGHTGSAGGGTPKMNIHEIMCISLPVSYP